MKLSANAREFVKAEVKAAFADDLRKANAAVEVAKKVADAKYKAFEQEYVKAKAEFAKKVVTIVKKHGLTVRKKGDVEEFSIQSVIVNAKGPFYGDLDNSVFDETCYIGSPVSSAAGKVNGIESDIGRAVAKALFEIEVHGKKDTLEQIVADVIREIREGE